MMRLATAALVGALLGGGLSASSAFAGGCNEVRGVCGTAAGSDFDFSGIEPSDGAQAGVQTGAGSATPIVRRQTRYAPTCTGNTYDNPGVVCSAAVDTCAEGTDEVRFWVWSRTFDEQLGEWSPWQLVDTVCLAGDDPAIDPAVAVPLTVQREFASVVVLKGRAKISPEPDTLVNVPTVLTTDAPASYDIPLTLLGQQVVITATAERYTWHFGDGQTGTSTAPQGRTEHEYARAETVEAYVVIEWSGTFRVNSGPSQPITGTATTTGVPTQVEVKQARAELVRD